MGRMGPAIGTVQHNGYALPFFADGAEGCGSYGVAGVLVDFDRDEWRPDGEVVGWRAGCACGWRGPDWERAPGPPRSATWGSVNARERKIHGVDALLDLLDDQAERAVLEDWREHIRPWIALEEATELAERQAAVSRELDTAVATARAGGATWADIGRAVGITRQSARERWATKLGDEGRDAS